MNSQTTATAMTTEQTQPPDIEKTLAEYRFHELSRDAMADLIGLLPDSNVSLLMRGLDSATAEAARTAKALREAQAAHDDAMNLRRSRIGQLIQKIQTEWTEAEIAEAIRYHIENSSLEAKHPA